MGATSILRTSVRNRYSVKILWAAIQFYCNLHSIQEDSAFQQTRHKILLCLDCLLVPIFMPERMYLHYEPSTNGNKTEFKSLLKESSAVLMTIWSTTLSIVISHPHIFCSSLSMWFIAACQLLILIWESALLSNVYTSCDFKLCFFWPHSP